MRTILESLGENGPCQLLGDLGLRVLTGEGKKGLRPGLKEDGKEGILNV